MISEGSLPVPNVVSRALFERVGGFPPAMVAGNEDRAFWLRALELKATYRHTGRVASCYRNFYSRAETSSMSSKSPAYKDLAQAMTVVQASSIHEPLVVCQALHHVASHIHKHRSLATVLERTLANSPQQCMGWVWLASIKLAVSCAFEAFDLLRQGRGMCLEAVRRGSEAPTALHVFDLFERDFAPSLVGGGDFALQPQANATCAGAASVFATPIPAATGCLCARSEPLYDPACPCTNATRPNAPFLGAAYKHYFAPPDAPSESYACPLWTSHDERRGPPFERGVPPVIHFIYGLADVPDQSFGFYQFAAIRSALVVHRPTQAFFHYAHEPEGEFWDAVRPQLILRRWPIREVSHHEGRCLMHHAHRADVLRLRVLYEYGGIYVDMDTLSLRPLTPALRRNAEFVIAQQQSDRARDRAVYGLCNAIMAAAPASRFVRYWLSLYSSFRSTGRDSFWDEHSVRLPAMLLASCPSIESAMTILPPRAFFPFYWDEAERFLFGPAGSRVAEHRLRDSFVIHLWAGSDPARSYMRRLSTLRLSSACAQLNGTLYGQLACSRLSL